MLDRLLARLVLGAVNHEEGPLPEVLVFFGEDSHELRDEEAEDLGVRVKLVHGAVPFPIRADRHLHRDSRCDVAIDAGGRLATLAPHAPCEIHIIDPGLIKVYDAHSRSKLIEQELAELCAENQATICIAEIWDSVERLEPGSYVVTEDGRDVLTTDFQAMVIKNALLNLLCFVEAIGGVQLSVGFVNYYA